MDNNLMKNLVKSSLERFGDKMDNKLCPLILYQPRSAKKHDVCSTNVKQKD